MPLCNSIPFSMAKFKTSKDPPIPFDAFRQTSHQTPLRLLIFCSFLGLVLSRMPASTALPHLSKQTNRTFPPLITGLLPYCSLIITKPLDKSNDICYNILVSIEVWLGFVCSQTRSSTDAANKPSRGNSRIASNNSISRCGSAW